jgi:hypothetical protein
VKEKLLELNNLEERTELWCNEIKKLPQVFPK